MPPIPHSLAAAFAAYGAPLLALGLALGVSVLCRAKAHAPWAEAGAAIAALVGWAVLTPAGRLAHVWTPRLGPQILLAPAAVCALGAGFLAWRRGGYPRLVATAMALFAGWWVARGTVGPAEFWRVWFIIAAVAGVVGWAVAGQAARGLACALALSGGLAAAGEGVGWAAAASVAVAVWAGLLPSGAALPSAAMAALIGAADLAGGRARHGHLGAVDLACMVALGAPFLAEAIATRWGKSFGKAGQGIGAVMAALVAVAVIWVFRRAVLT